MKTLLKLGSKNIIGKNLKLIRKKNKLTQEQLALADFDDSVVVDMADVRAILKAVTVGEDFEDNLYKAFQSYQHAMHLICAYMLLFYFNNIRKFLCISWMYILKNKNYQKSFIIATTCKSYASQKRITS